MINSSKYFILFFLSKAVLSGGFTLCSNEENTIAQRLMGTWVMDKDLFERFSQDDDMNLQKVVFYEDESCEALDIFPNLNAEHTLHNYCIYQYGKMDFYVQENVLLGVPFILTSHEGMPYIFWMESYSEDSFDMEAFQVSMFPGQDRNNDVLGLGPDLYSDEDMSMMTFKRL